VAVLGLVLLFCVALVEWATAHYALPRPAWALWLQIVAAIAWLVALPRIRSARALTIGTGAVCAIMALCFAVFLLTLKQS
jgi:hypothetical protein